MEVPESYLEQCKAAGPMIMLKRELGFNEGDHIWDGEKIRLIGHDSLNATKKHDPKYPAFTFAMLEPQPVMSINDTEFPCELTIKYGTYVFEVIRNPVWIPTIGQLQSYLLRSYNDYTKLLEKFIHFTRYHNSYRQLSKIKEQLWLDYFMWKRFNLLWNIMEHNWEFYPGPLSEEN